LENRLPVAHSEPNLKCLKTKILFYPKIILPTSKRAKLSALAEIETTICPAKIKDENKRRPIL
jgi:hypothetical protein